ncbi:hypothetical protein BCR35DRAFT_300460 [Leucosporidium creatinivorum]|uniref:Uncharacterized protein n=1 Tax=Leucosporidium creatinivorum TaxID=106004 RepID=A0A1Y2FYY2_9BASI|nr:hypothetical protein BCR35DRAFT_300460 [Leucosporidium creatinivorum]
MAASRLTRASSILRTLPAGPSSVYATPSAFPCPPSTSRFPISDLRGYRPFSTTPSHRASEAPQSPWEAKGFQSEVPLFERLQQHPECLAAIEHLATTVQAKTGVNLTGGEAPSMKMMWALANDPELRQAAENLMLSLKAAGIEVDPKAAFTALKMMGGEGFEGNQELNDLHNAMRKSEGGEGEGEGEGKGKK